MTQGQAAVVNGLHVVQPGQRPTEHHCGFPHDANVPGGCCHGPGRRWSCGSLHVARFLQHSEGRCKKNIGRCRDVENEISHRPVPVTTPGRATFRRSQFQEIVSSRFEFDQSRAPDLKPAALRVSKREVFRCSESAKMFCLQFHMISTRNFSTGLHAAADGNFKLGKSALFGRSSAVVHLGGVRASLGWWVKSIRIWGVYLLCFDTLC